MWLNICGSFASENVQISRYRLPLLLNFYNFYSPIYTSSYQKVAYLVLQFFAVVNAGHCPDLRQNKPWSTSFVSFKTFFRYPNLFYFRSCHAAFHFQYFSYSSLLHNFFPLPTPTSLQTLLYKVNHKFGASSTTIISLYKLIASKPNRLTSRRQAFGQRTASTNHDN